MMSGGCGVGAINEMAEQLLSNLKEDIQIVALAGKNRKLFDKLNEISPQYPGKLKPMGFTNTIERVMCCADIAVSKSGGLTTSECLAMGLPMIVISPIPGQEERNADYLLENGAGMKACDYAGLEYRLKFLLENPDKLEIMRKNAKNIGKPHAAKKVLDIVLGKKTM